MPLCKETAEAPDAAWGGSSRLLGHRDSDLLTTTFRPGWSIAESGLLVAMALHSVAMRPWPLRIISKELVVGVDEKPQFLPKQPGAYE